MNNELLEEELASQAYNDEQEEKKLKVQCECEDDIHQELKNL